VPPLKVPGLHLAYAGSDAKIYANSEVLPRTWLVSQQQVVANSEQALTGIVAPGFNPRRTVLTEHKLPGLSEQQSPGAAPGIAHITSYGAEQVTIAAQSDRAAELVLSDTYYPGWKVTVNGHPTPISQVDYLLRGVAVPAGNDRIVFTYDPSSFRTGWVISLAAALVVAAALAVTIFRRRPRAGRHVRSDGPSSLSESPAEASPSERSVETSSRAPPPT
jgi:Bacterial membrane protein YfhO